MKSTEYYTAGKTIPWKRRNDLSIWSLTEGRTSKNAHRFPILQIRCWDRDKSPRTEPGISFLFTVRDRLLETEVTFGLHDDHYEKLDLEKCISKPFERPSKNSQHN